LDLSRVYTTLGDIDIDSEKNLSHAQINYTLLMENDSTFFLRNVEVRDWQREMSWAFSKEGDLILKKQQGPQRDQDWMAETERARADYDKALCLRTHLLEQEEDENTKISRDVAVTYEHLADVSAMLSDRGLQKSDLLASLRIRKQLVAVDRADSGYREDLVKIYEKLARVYWVDPPTTSDDILSRRVAAAFFQAAFVERRRLAELQGGRSESEIKDAKDRAEQRLDAIKADGMITRLADGWWDESIIDEETNIQKPAPMNFTTCIEAVTRAAKAVAPESVANIVR
jgi:hypothetical protein